MCRDLGWGDAPRPSLKQGYAQFLLEQRDLPRNHRRRGVQGVGGSPYRTMLINRIKIPQALLIDLAHTSSVRCSLGNKIMLQLLLLERSATSLIVGRR